MITLYQKPLSLNQMYPTGKGGRRFATPKSKAYKQSWASLAQAHYKEFTNYDSPLAIIITVAGPIFTLEGSISKTAIDCDNIAKPIIDGIADALGFNDSIVTSLFCRKAYADNWSISVTLKPDDSF